MAPSVRHTRLLCRDGGGGGWSPLPWAQTRPLPHTDALGPVMEAAPSPCDTGPSRADLILFTLRSLRSPLPPSPVKETRQHHRLDGRHWGRCGGGGRSPEQLICRQGPSGPMALCLAHRVCHSRPWQAGPWGETGQRGRPRSEIEGA